MAICQEKVECIKMMDEKVKPVYSKIGKKLDKSIFFWIFFPSIIIILGAVGFGYNSNKAEIDKYDGMELRLVKEIQQVKEDIGDKIEKMK